MTGPLAPLGSESAVGALPMPAAYFKLILRRFGATPEATARLLLRTGIEAPESLALAPNDRVQLWQAIQQIRNLLEVAPPGCGLDLGRALDAGAHGALGVATAGAPTLAEALSVLERFAHLRAPYFRLASESGRSAFVLRIEAQLLVDERVWAVLLEALLLSLQALIESALGQPMREGSFAIDYPAPSYAQRYAECFHAPVVFSQPTAAVAIPRAWLSLPSPFADEAQHRSALQQLESAQRSLHGPQLIVAQVERLLEGARETLPDLGSVASRLGLSRRTLVRRLEQRGTSFRALVDAHRQRRAAALLADPHLTISEVAYQLGYTDLANFGRAFRRWFGTSPRAHRKQIPAPAAAAAGFRRPA